MKTFPLLTWWLSILAIATFTVLEVYSHNHKQQPLSVLIFKLIFLNSPFILLMILAYFRQDIPSWLYVARLVIVIVMTGASALSHYFLLTSGASGSGVLLTLFVGIFLGIVVVTEAAAWLHVKLST